MRTKIIAVNAVIVVLIGLLSFALIRAAVGSAAGNTTQLQADAKHDVQSASARLQLDGLRTERWLAGKAAEGATLEVMSKSSPTARAEAATSLSDAVLSAAMGSPAFAGNVPSLVVLVDAQGKILGRNGSTLGRGDDLAALYPGLKTALATGQSGSDVWFTPPRNDQYLASYAPVKNEQGRVMGAIAAGFTLNDELSRVSEATTGRALKLVMLQGAALVVVANSAYGSDQITEALAGPAKDSLKGALTQGHVALTETNGVIVAAAPIDGFGDGHRAGLVGAKPASLIENITGMLLPLVAGVTLLGLVLVIAGGWLLGTYITSPITELEEGLLAILNGQTDKRFQLDHPDLGGLAFRIDQLLNQLMGIEEDNTDSEGRISKAPSNADFNAAMNVDDKRAQADDAMDAQSLQQLAAEPIDAYYARIYGEYIAAKKSFGEPTDHISDAAFKGRIQGMEQEASTKYGKPVRYKVQTRGREVILLAIPLG
jgi:hypothetical protein